MLFLEKRQPLHSKNLKRHPYQRRADLLDPTEFLDNAKKIKLGSTLNELIVAYQTSINYEDSAPDSEFVVGSIYGGLIFQLKDSVVVKIYIGAAVE